MEFEWDPAKHEMNLRTRGIGFDEAAQIFDAEVIVWPDMRADYGESRINGTGEADGKILRVVYTIRGRTVRIITAWRASRKDRERWQIRS